MVTDGEANAKAASTLTIMSHTVLCQRQLCSLQLTGEAAELMVLLHCQCRRIKVKPKIISNLVDFLGSGVQPAKLAVLTYPPFDL